MTHRVSNGISQPRPVEAFDNIGDSHRVTRLVGLQSADQMQAQIGVRGPQQWELGGCFLHPVFTKDGLTAGQRRLDSRDRMGFRYCDEGDVTCLPPGPLGGGGDARAHVAQVGGDGGYLYGPRRTGIGREVYGRGRARWR